MSKKIFLNMLFTDIVILLCSMIFIVGGFYYYHAGQQQERLQELLGMVRSSVEKFGVDYLEETDFGSYRVTLISSEGEVLFDTSADPETMENHGAREEVLEALKEGEGQGTRAIRRHC